MSEPFTEIVMVAAELKMFARPAYDSLVKALWQLEAKLKDDLNVADGNDVYRAQGKSQLMKELCQKLDGCIEARERMIGRK